MKKKSLNRGLRLLLDLRGVAVENKLMATGARLKRSERTSAITLVPPKLQ